MASCGVAQSALCAHHEHCSIPKPLYSTRTGPTRRPSLVARANAVSRHRTARNVKVYAAASEVIVEDSEDATTTAKLRIKLKSYNVPVMKEAEQQILDAAGSTGATVAGPVHLPTRIKRWCVLRSPHVNKDSREHFEMRIHQRLIDIKDLSAQTIDKFMNLNMPAGVDVNVKLL